MAGVEEFRLQPFTACVNPRKYLEVCHGYRGV